MSVPDRGRTTSVLVGTVVDNRDPKKLGRVRVKLPGEEKSSWARVAVPMAGAKRGAYFLPDVGDEVLVAFEAGDVSLPFVLGALWNGQDRPPATNADGQNNVRLIRSRSGHTLEFDDTPNNEKISIAHAGGNLSIVIDATSGGISLTALSGDITLRAPSGAVRLEGASVEIDASGALDIHAGATVSVNGALVKIN